MKKTFLLLFFTSLLLTACTNVDTVGIFKIHRLFVALNESNNLLIKQIENGVDNLQIISADGIRPTRKNVFDTSRIISRGTGTLLSESDRILGDRFSDEVVLTMYRLNGLIDNSWNGSPLWVPNIKFPSGFCFYTVD